MVVYNRRKRAIYFAEEERTQARILGLARSAVADGTASPAQAALVSGIAEEQEALEKKQSERKLPSRLLWWAHGDWKEEKELAEQRKVALAEVKRQEALAAQGSGITAAVQEARAKSSTSLAPPESPLVGGRLDNTAEKAAHKVEQAAQKVEQTGKGWFGWMMGGSKKE